MIGNCIIEIKTDHFLPYFNTLLKWGTKFDRYTQRYVTEAHALANPEVRPYIGMSAEHRDFGVNEGTTKIKEIIDVTSVINKKVKIGTINFLHFPPDASIPVHKDPPARESLLIIPLTPLDNYSYPIFDYNNKKYFLKTINPQIINTQIPHSLHNKSSKDRVNFQLGLKHSFTEIKEMLKYDNFFTK